MKLSENKITWPGPKQVHRCFDGDTFSHDVIELADAPPPEGSVPLLRPVMKDGELLPAAHDTLASMRERCADGLASLPEEMRALHDHPEPPVRIGPALRALAEDLKGKL